jgi:hypothetical protein
VAELDVVSAAVAQARSAAVAQARSAAVVMVLLVLGAVVVVVLVQTLVSARRLSAAPRAQFPMLQSLLWILLK